jgi:hypothetical protein
VDHSKVIQDGGSTSQSARRQPRDFASTPLAIKISADQPTKVIQDLMAK